MGIIGEKAFAYSVWETYANETEGIYFSLQESIKITGVVKDNKGEPIIGANIVELNKKGNGTITDIDGKFTLSVSKNAEISISFIGFDEKKIKIGQQTSFDIILEESSQFLDEVVVVGMNNRQTRRSVTGAISTIQTKELKQSPVANLSNALAGKLPGLINCTDFWTARRRCVFSIYPWCRYIWDIKPASCYRWFTSFSNRF